MVEHYQTAGILHGERPWDATLALLGPVLAGAALKRVNPELPTVIDPVEWVRVFWWDGATDGRPPTPPQTPCSAGRVTRRRACGATRRCLGRLAPPSFGDRKGTDECVNPNWPQGGGFIWPRLGPASPIVSLTGLTGSGKAC